MSRLTTTSRPDRGSQSRSQAEAGWSLVEVIVTSVLLVAMLYAVTTLSMSGSQASDLSRRLTRASEVTQQVVDSMRLELTSSVRLFGNDTEGQENMQVVDLSGAPTPLANLRLPTINTADKIRVDTVGSEVTGNILFFAKLAWSDRFVCTSTNEYLVDVVRWIGYYLTPEAGGPRPGSSIGLNLVRIVSEPLVEAASLDVITDTDDLDEILVHLANGTPDASGESHPRCEIVWRRGALPSVTGTIRQIDPSDGSLSSTPFGGRATPFEIERSEQQVEGILYYRHHSVASNYSLPSYGVSTFAVKDNTGTGFPHGFEVQIAGPSSARQVLLHLVVASTNSVGHLAWSNAQVVVDARDL